MKKIIFLFSMICLPYSAFASVELFQIVALGWDESGKKLSVVSLGSGTAIEKNLVLTNKHVIQVNDRIADFILLCQADNKRTKGVKCEIPAGVVAVHPDFDAALIKPIAEAHYFPAVRAISGEAHIGTQVRLAGFPIPLEKSSLQGFGGTKTLDGVKAWAEGLGGALEFKGDELTITRGQVVNKGVLESTGGHYLVTNAKVNFGNSGGAAFDQYGNFVGIPSLKDQNSNAYILSYYQLRAWIEKSKSQSPQTLEAAVNFYHEFVGHAKTQIQKKPGVSKNKRSLLRKSTSKSGRSIRAMTIRERLKARRSRLSTTETTGALSQRSVRSTSKYRTTGRRYGRYRTYSRTR